MALWDNLEERIFSASAAALSDIVHAAGDDAIYAVCLSTSEDGMSVGLNANTIRHFERRLAEERTVRTVDASYQSYLKWTCGEWEHEGTGDEHFTSVNKDLYDHAVSDDASQAGFERIVEAMIGALRKLRGRMKAHGIDADAVTLFATVTDGEDILEIENRSATILNPVELAEPFLSRYPE